MKSDIVLEVGDYVLIDNPVDSVYNPPINTLAKIIRLIPIAEYHFEVTYLLPQDSDIECIFGKHEVTKIDPTPAQIDLYKVLYD